MSLKRPEVLRLLADGKQIKRTSKATYGFVVFSIAKLRDAESLAEFDKYTWTEITPPKRVPLGPEDIDLHRDLFQHVNSQAGGVFVPIGKSATGIHLGSYVYEWDSLCNDWHRSTDGGKTWQSCEKEES